MPLEKKKAGREKKSRLVDQSFASYVSVDMTSDYIAMSALLVSLISAWISIRSWRFNVRIKSLELRAVLLTSLHNALRRLESVLRGSLCKNKALDAKKTELFKRLTADEKMRSTVKKLRAKIQEVESGVRRQGGKPLWTFEWLGYRRFPAHRRACKQERRVKERTA